MKFLEDEREIGVAGAETTVCKIHDVQKKATLNIMH